MPLDQLRQTLSELLNSITRLFTKVTRAMRIDDLRFGFGPRAPLPDEEAARIPLMSPQGTRHSSDVPSDRESAMTEDASRDRHNDYQEPISMANSNHRRDPPQGDDSRLAASAVQVPGDTPDYSATRLPKKPRLPMSSGRSKDESRTSHHEPEGASSAAPNRRHGRVFLFDMPSFNDGTDGSPENPHELNHDHSSEEDPIDNTILAGERHASHTDGQQPDYGEPFLSLKSGQKAEIAGILRPILPALFRLRDTTRRRMPPYNPHMRTKSHSQVVKNRLVDIADHITSYLRQNVPEDTRGVVELRIYRYIADHYWPLPVTPSTHLDILRIVRNMTFSQTPSIEVADAQKAHEEWADEFRERLCESFGESFGEAAARCFAARNKTAAVVGEANGTKSSNKLIQDQEEVLQGDPYHSTPSMSQPWDDTTDPLVATAKAMLYNIESPMPNINKALEVEPTVDPRLLNNVEYDNEKGEIEELGPYGYDPVPITSTHNQIIGNTAFLQPTLYDDSHHMNTLEHPESDLPAPLVSSRNDPNLNDDYKIAIHMAQEICDDDDTSTLHGGESRTPVDYASLTPDQQMKLDAEFAERMQSEEYGGESTYAGGATAAWENSKTAVQRRLGAVSHRLGAMSNGAGNAGENLDQDVLFPDGDEEMDKDC